MERIIINGFLYRVKNGTTAKISKASENGLLAPGHQHESGQAFREYNDLLDDIAETQNGIYIHQSFSSY